MSMTETLAQVIDLPHPFQTPPAADARELPHRKHVDGIPTAPHDRTEWLIESQIASLHDQLLSPSWFVRTVAPEIADQVESLLDTLFDASAAAWDARYDGTAHRTVAEVAYDDALYELARVVRGNVERGCSA